jgi:hypothetical protein
MGCWKLVLTMVAPALLGLLEEEEESSFLGSLPPEGREGGY